MKVLAHHMKDDGAQLDIFPPRNSRCVSEEDSYGSNMGGLKKTRKQWQGEQVGGREAIIPRRNVKPELRLWLQSPFSGD